MPLPRPASPSALWSDLRGFARERGKHQWIAAGLAVLMPVVIIFVFWLDGQTNLGPKEQVIFVESWSADRSDEEIKARLKADVAAEEKRQAERQAAYKKLQERFGTNE